MRRITILCTAVVLLAIACGGGVEVTESIKADALIQIERIQMPEYESWAMDKTKSGIRYIELERAGGRLIERRDEIEVHYNLWLPNGLLVDSSQFTDDARPLTFVVGAGMVIEGWDEIVQLMREGNTFLAVIPPKLGYGGKATGPIPANSKLIFSIEIVRIK